MPVWVNDLDDRLNRIEEGLREMRSAPGNGQPSDGFNSLAEASPGGQNDEFARQQALASLLSNPGLFEKIFAPLAEHLHFLRVESEFTFRLVYCVREFVKKYLVRQHLEARLPKDKMTPPGPNQAAQLNQFLGTLMVAEQTEFDGRALTALEDIRSGKIYERQQETSHRSQQAQPAPPTDQRGGTNDPRRRDPNILEEIASDLENEELLDRQSRLEAAERAAESIDLQTEP